MGYFKNIANSVSTLVTGLKVTLGYFVRARAYVTLQYPDEKWPNPERNIGVGELDAYNVIRSKLHVDIDDCIGCKKCDTTCPASLPVSRRRAVRDNACIGCMECVSVCPVSDCLEPKAANRTINPIVVVVGGLVLFFLFWVWARSTGHWVTEIPDHLFRELYPKLRSLGHPSF